MSILVYNKIILYPFYIGIFWYISYLALLSNKFLCRILWDLKWIRIAYTLSLNYIIDITEMVTTSNGPDLMKAKRVNTFKRTLLLLLSSRTKKFILLPLHSFYPPNKHSVNLVKGKQAKGKKTWPTMTLTFDKLIMFNVYAHLLTFDLKTLLKSLHTLYAEAFCGWSTSQIGQRGHMTHSLDEDNTYRSSMTLTLDLGNLFRVTLYKYSLPKGTHCV